MMNIAYEAKKRPEYRIAGFAVPLHCRYEVVLSGIGSFMLMKIDRPLHVGFATPSNRGSSKSRVSVVCREQDGFNIRKFG